MTFLWSAAFMIKIAVMAKDRRRSQSQSECKDHHHHHHHHQVSQFVDPTIHPKKSFSCASSLLYQRNMGILLESIVSASFRCSLLDHVEYLYVLIFLSHQQGVKEIKEISCNMYTRFDMLLIWQFMHACTIIKHFLISFSHSSWVIQSHSVPLQTDSWEVSISRLKVIHHCEQKANKHIFQLLVCSVCSATLANAAHANDGIYLIKTTVVGARSVFALILVIGNTFCFLKAAFYQLVKLVRLSLFSGLLVHLKLYTSPVLLTQWPTNADTHTHIIWSLSVFSLVVNGSWLGASSHNPSDGYP